MEWANGKKISRGAKGQFSKFESVSGEYRVTPDAGGRFHAYHKDVKISKRGMGRKEAQEMCETHATDNRTPEFVANVPPTGQYMSFKESEPLVPIPGTVTFSDTPPEVQTWETEGGRISTHDDNSTPRANDSTYL